MKTVRYKGIKKKCSQKTAHTPHIIRYISTEEQNYHIFCPGVGKYHKIIEEKEILKNLISFKWKDVS